MLIQREAIGLNLEQLQQWLPGWNATGGKLLYEIDDGLLDAEGLRARRHAGDVDATAAKVCFLASYADLVHLSTESLAQRVKPFNSREHVIPNALDGDLWRLSTQRRHDQGPFRSLPDGPVRISYIGTSPHDEDLARVGSAMRAIEAKYGSTVEFEVIGGFPKLTPKFGKCVALPKKNDYLNFVGWLQERVHWHIGTIPLVTTPFNEARNYLKFLEDAALDMAIVASDVPCYRTVANHGNNCLLARAYTEDWIKKLTLLIDDRYLRQQLALIARRACASMHMLNDIAPQIVRRLKSCI